MTKKFRIWGLVQDRLSQGLILRRERGDSYLKTDAAKRGELSWE